MKYTQEMVNKLMPAKVRRLQLEGKISRAMLTAYCQYHNSQYHNSKENNK